MHGPRATLFLLAAHRNVALGQHLRKHVFQFASGPSCRDDMLMPFLRELCKCFPVWKGPLKRFSPGTHVKPAVQSRITTALGSSGPGHRKV